MKAIVITGANGVFSGGFDISKFQDGGADEDLSSNVNKAFLDLVETGPKPTVAAVSKIALGGGCELAVSCNARVATPGLPPPYMSRSRLHSVATCRPITVGSRAGTKIGLPELQLGIIPGFGGTQRLPRLVGLQQAVMMMLTSQPISAEKGMQAGLIDVVVPPANLLPKARALALDIANLRTARKITIDHTAKLESLAEAEAILRFARDEATKRAGLHAPQLPMCTAACTTLEQQHTSMTVLLQLPSTLIRMVTRSALELACCTCSLDQALTASSPVHTMQRSIEPPLTSCLSSSMRLHVGPPLACINSTTSA